MSGAAHDVLADPDELLFRQVHPNFVTDGRVSSQAFQATKKDEGMLSVSRGASITARAAYELHVQGKQLKSAGSWAVTVGECSAAGLATRSDPLSSPPEPVADPAHAVVEMTGLTRGQVERAASVLADAARGRGRLYPRVESE